MLKLRQGTFESNSSSMHTLIRISNANLGDFLEERNGNFLPIDDNVEEVVFDNDEDFYYGRCDCELLKNAIEKATFLIVYYGVKTWDEGENKNQPEDIPHYFEILREVRKTHPTFKGWRRDDSKGCWYPMGMVDGQSQDILDDIPFEQVLSTINDQNVVYVLSGDEFSLMTDMVKNGLICEEDFVAPNFTNEELQSFIEYDDEDDGEGYIC